MTSEIQPELARAMIEQAADAIIFADVHGVIQVWNRAAILIFGFEANEALGRSLDLIIPEHLRAAHWAGFHRAMASGKTRLAGRATTTRALCKSGQRLYVEMSFALVRGSAGTIVGSVAVARDATIRFEEERSRAGAVRRVASLKRCSTPFHSLGPFEIIFRSVRFSLSPVQHRAQLWATALF